MFRRELVCAVGFDLDGTLYKTTPEIEEIIMTAISRIILELKPDYGTIENASDAFQRFYIPLNNTLMAIAKAANVPLEQAPQNWTEEARTKEVLKPDFELVGLLDEIQKRYTTYLLTSSTEKSALRKLEALCINPEVFNFRGYDDTPGMGSKSKGGAYQFILEQTGISAQNHVYVGDRAKQDILPSKSLGMQTIAVWSEIPEADLSIKTIYDLEDVLT